MNRTHGQGLVLADALWPAISLRRDAALTILGTLLLALSAQLEIPLHPVPITGQTFGVLLIGAVLGSKRGALSVLAYLAAGAAGLPVFAGFGFGPAKFLGLTGGYLLGFVPAAFVVGLLCERGWDRRVWTTAMAMTLGTVLIYVPGILWLSRFMGWDQTLQFGVVPFVPGDLLKVALAALALPPAHRLLGNRECREQVEAPGPSVQDGPAAVR